MTTQNLQRTSGFGYRIMASYLKFRERFRKPEDFLRSLGIKRGDVILDHGCGIGSYSIPAAKMVGVTGKVYALDIHPIGIEKTQKRAEKEGLRNLETILSGLENGLPDQYVDIVLLIDVFTWIEDKVALLNEFHRVLKPSGQLVVLIDHASPDECKTIVDKTGQFRLAKQDGNVLYYLRV